MKSLNIGDTNILQNIAIAAGCDGAEFKRYIISDDDHSYILEQDTAIRRLGVTGVPCFIVDGRYAIAGAQSPEIFHQIFDLADQQKSISTVSRPAKQADKRRF